MKNVLNSKELCEYLHIAKTTMWRLLKNGKIPQPKRLSDRILLWDKAEIDEMLGLKKP